MYFYTDLSSLGFETLLSLEEFINNRTIPIIRLNYSNPTELKNYLVKDNFFYQVLKGFEFINKNYKLTEPSNTKEDFVDKLISLCNDILRTLEYEIFHITNLLDIEAKRDLEKFINKVNRKLFDERNFAYEFRISDGQIKSDDLYLESKDILNKIVFISLHSQKAVVNKYYHLYTDLGYSINNEQLSSTYNDYKQESPQEDVLFHLSSWVHYIGTIV